MEKYHIRRAESKDIPLILEYIENNWMHNHWLVRREGAFKWQYTSDNLDFIIGINSDNQIKGIMGYISYDDNDERDIALSMWMANPEDGFLGIQLLQFIMKEIPHRVMFSPGINVGTTESIYRIFHISTGRMKQWYRLSPRRKYKIAVIADRTIPEVCDSKDVCFEKYNTIADLKAGYDIDAQSRESVPYKSVVYIDRHYYKHPEYKYEVYGIRHLEEKKAKTLIVLRAHEHEKGSVMILADVIGDLNNIPKTTTFLDKLMAERGCEYIHTYVTGVSDELLSNAGWIKTEGSGNIIPNYFYPLLQENVTVAYCTTNENIVMFKGDGDQDRPK